MPGDQRFNTKWSFNSNQLIFVLLQVQCFILFFFYEQTSFMLVLCSRQIPAKANKLILSYYMLPVSAHEGALLLLAEPHEVYPVGTAGKMSSITMFADKKKILCIGMSKKQMSHNNFTSSLHSCMSNVYQYRSL